MSEDRIGEQLTKHREHLGEEILNAVDGFEEATGIEVNSIRCHWLDKKTGSGGLDPVERTRQVQIVLNV